MKKRIISLALAVSLALGGAVAMAHDTDGCKVTPNSRYQHITRHDHLWSLQVDGVVIASGFAQARAGAVQQCEAAEDRLNPLP